MAVHHLIAADLVIGSPQIEPAKAKRQRNPRIDKMITQAERGAGRPVTSVTTPDGYTLTFGKPDADQTNDLDKWMAKHHAN